MRKTEAIPMTTKQAIKAQSATYSVFSVNFSAWRETISFALENVDKQILN
jgi:hypothetical protein